MGTRTRQARGLRETPHWGADRARRLGWRRTRPEPTRPAVIGSAAGAIDKRSSPSAGRMRPLNAGPNASGNSHRSAQAAIPPLFPASSDSSMPSTYRDAPLQPPAFGIVSHVPSADTSPFATRRASLAWSMAAGGCPVEGTPAIPHSGRSRQDRGAGRDSRSQALPARSGPRHSGAVPLRFCNSCR